MPFEPLYEMIILVASKCLAQFVERLRRAHTILSAIIVLIEKSATLSAIYTHKNERLTDRKPR